MKKVTLLFSVLLLSVCGLAQVTTTPATNGQCDGTATLTNSGQYISWKWYKQDTLKQTGGTTFGNLCPGTYFISRQDTTHTDTVYFQIVTGSNPCNNFNATISTTNESQQGACDGTLSVTGNSYIVSYVWSDSAFTGANISNVCSGSYTVTVTDSANCVKTVSATIMADTNSAPCNNFAVTISKTNESQQGACDGTLNVTTNSFAVSYVWSDTSFTGAQITNVCSGAYTVTVTDSAGCVKTVSATVTSDTTSNPCNNFTASISTTNETQSGACDGALNVTTNSFVVSYVWSDSTFTGANITNVCSGAYTVTLTDSTGCVKTVSATVVNDTTYNPCSSFSASVAATNETQSGACNGTLSVTSNSFVVSYVWSDSTFTGANITNVCSGVYTVTVTDSAGCVKTASATVSTDSTSNPCNNFTVTATATNESSAGACNGTLSVTTNSFAVSYVWSDSTYTGANITNVCSGAYSVTVTDSAGCSATASATVGTDTTSNPCANISVSIASVANQTFPGACNGSATAVVNNGSSPFAFNWGNGLSSTTAQFNGLCAGTFTLTVTDAAGCSATTTGSVNTDSVPGPCNGVVITATLTATDASAGLCDGSVSSAITGGTAPYVLTWNNGYHTSGLSNVCPGYYNVLVKDANDCLGSSNIVVMGDSTMPVPLMINVSTYDVDSAGACNGAAFVNASGGVGPYAITYSNGISGSQAYGLCGGYYTAFVTDANGSGDSISFVIGSPENTFTTTTETNLDDSVVVASLTNNAVLSCSIDYSAIDSILITNYYLGNNDSIVVLWTLYITSGDTIITQLYGVGPDGVYEVVLSLFCESRAVGDFAKAYGKILVNDQLTGISGNAAKSKTVLYPNPFSSSFNAVLNSNSKVTITDIAGKVVFTTAANAGALYVQASSFSKGVYFVIIENAKGREVSKLIKE